MPPQFSKIFADFSDLLKKRLEAKLYTEEDMIRYLFFYACTQNGVQPNEFTLEKHVFPENPRLELDTFIERAGERPSVAVEFKYNRNNNVGSNSAKTRQAGKICNDLNRLVSSPEGEKRIFVYVTDKEMQDYFKTMKKLQKWCAFLYDFFTLPQAKEMNVVVPENAPQKFTENAGGFSQCTVKTLFRNDYDCGTALRIYEVSAI